MITKDTELTELFDTACKLANDIVLSGETFRVKDLFRGVEWDRIPKGLRSKLGAMFLAYVNSDAKGVFNAAGKTPLNQQIYQKV
ncbi:MAG: single-stranded DNA-binding protein [Clostridiales bacterium]|nr:single-stranded DNA-binding protein [Clostridiales bacterium]